MINHGNAMAVICLLMVVYAILATHCISDTTPVGIAGSHNSSHRFHTRFYGTLSDKLIVNMFRSQKCFNILMTEIFGHVTVAFHWKYWTDCHFCCTPLLCSKVQSCVSGAGGVCICHYTGMFDSTNYSYMESGEGMWRSSRCVEGV